MASRELHELQFICCRHASVELLIFHKFVSRPLANTVADIILWYNRMHTLGARTCVDDEKYNAVMTKLGSLVNTNFHDWLLRVRHTVLCGAIADMTQAIHTLSKFLGGDGVQSAFSRSKQRPRTTINIETVMAWKSTPLNRVVTPSQFTGLCRIAFPLLFRRGELAKHLDDGDYEMYELQEVQHSNEDEWVFRNFVALLREWLDVRPISTLGQKNQELGFVFFLPIAIHYPFTASSRVKMIFGNNHPRHPTVTGARNMLIQTLLAKYPGAADVIGPKYVAYSDEEEETVAMPMGPVDTPVTPPPTYEDSQLEYVVTPVVLRMSEFGTTGAFFCFFLRLVVPAFEQLPLDRQTLH